LTRSRFISTAIMDSTRIMNWEGHG